MELENIQICPQCEETNCTCGWCKCKLPPIECQCGWTEKDYEK